MRKVLFLFLAVASTYFFGCKSAEDITAPQNLNKGDSPLPLVWGDPVAGSSIYTVDLIAGQFNDVGDVTLEKVGNGLKITYEIATTGCTLTTVHVDLAKSTGAIPFAIDFHVNSQGSPDFGNWDTKTIGTIDMTDPTSVVVTFTEAELKLALGVTTIPSKFYIGIHGVVSCPNGVTSFICPENIGTRVVTGIDYPPNYYIGMTFDQPIDGQTHFNGWCLDLSRPFSNVLNQTVRFKCSYETFTDTCLIENYQNLAKANWIINHKDGYDKMVIQCALWYLLENVNGNDYNWVPDYAYLESQYMALVNAADPNFIPSCGDKVLEIVYQDVADPCTNTFFGQIVGIEVDAQCSYSNETVMGFKYPVDNTSSLFPGSKWFRYISLNY